ncbi:MAG: hypothetical protein AAGB19_05120, partial [Cyanobacteria bacterium P01_F01_bin.3]
LSTQYQPQVDIIYPKADQVIDTDQVKVKLKLKGLSVYKDEDLDLGPHIQVILDSQPPRSVYSLSESVTFDQLTPGSHTLRVVAVTPWGESFKNEAAYAQTTFHVFAATGENTPNPEQPLLTYLEPQGTYGAQPILLDFHLNNAPLHQVAQASSSDNIVDWQIRCSVNGQSFIFDQWQPLYLKGLNPGRNWIQLTLIDREGNPIKNVFNSTVHTFTYDPNQRDSLSQLIRGELPIEKVGQIVDQGYEPPPIVPLPSQTDLLDDTESAEEEALTKPADIETRETADNEQTSKSKDKPAAKQATAAQDSGLDKQETSQRQAETSNAIAPDKADAKAAEVSKFSPAQPPDSEEASIQKTVEDLSVDSDDTEPKPSQSQSEDAPLEINQPQKKPQKEDPTEKSPSMSESEPESASEIKGEKSRTDNLFQRFKRLFGSSPVNQPEGSSPDEKPLSIIEPAVQTDQTEPAEQVVQQSEQTEAQEFNAADDDKSSNVTQPLLNKGAADSNGINLTQPDSTDPDSSEPDAPQSLSIPPSTSETLVEPLSTDGSTSDTSTSSDSDEPASPSVEAASAKTATPTESVDETIERRQESVSGLFSQLSNQVKAFFQPPASSGSTAKYSDQLSIEELPVIVEEQIVEEPVRDDAATSNDETSNDAKSNDNALDSDELIDTDEQIDLQPEDTELGPEDTELGPENIELENEPFESVVVPETLSSPGLPSDDVLAPLEP